MVVSFEKGRRLRAILQEVNHIKSLSANLPGTKMPRSQRMHPNAGKFKLLRKNSGHLSDLPSATWRFLDTTEAFPTMASGTLFKAFRGSATTGYGFRTTSVSQGQAISTTPLSGWSIAAQMGSLPSLWEKNCVVDVTRSLSSYAGRGGCNGTKLDVPLSIFPRIYALPTSSANLLQIRPFQRNCFLPRSRFSSWPNSSGPPISASRSWHCI